MLNVMCGQMQSPEQAFFYTSLPGALFTNMD